MAMMPSPMSRRSRSSSKKMAVPSTKLNLPAGFRFHPTDEELIVHYLTNQAAAVPIPCPVPIIAEVNIYQCNPWDLPAKALFGESEWYFFSPRERKYPNGARPNRAAGSGYWKATGTDKPIVCSPTGKHVGVKKALVFYGGRPPRGVKTDWIMHEYRLVVSSASADDNTTAAPKRRGGSSMRLDDWVLCRIHKKSNDFQLKLSPLPSDHQQEASSTVEDEESPKPEPLIDYHEHDDLFQFQFQFHPQTTTTMSKSYSLTDLLNSIDCAALSQILIDGPTDGEALHLPQQIQNAALIYPTPTQTHQALMNYNNNNNNFNINNSNLNNSQLNMPPVVHTNAAASSSADYLVANNNCNNNGGVKNKRKRIMMASSSAMDDSTAADESLDDGTNGFSSRKLKAMLPASDSSTNNSSSYFGTTSSSSSSYCNQQIVDTSGLFQYSSLLSYPFLEMQ